MFQTMHDLGEDTVQRENTSNGSPPESASPAIALHTDAEALARLSAEAIAALTEAATLATYYRDDLTPEQVAANRRIVAISADACAKAAENPHQHFAAAFVDDTFAGFVIATRYADNPERDRNELDWMMVHPRHHGMGLAARLMHAGINWLGTENPQWLNVIRHNERAIGFYRKFGYEIDPNTATNHVIPHWIMRRPAGLPLT